MMVRRIKAAQHTRTAHHKPANRTRAVAAVVHHDAPRPDAQFLSRRQVADRTGLNLELIDRAIHNGDLTASKIGRRVLIEWTAALAWVRGAQI